MHHNAGEILTKAAIITEGSRQQTHGDKERSFAAVSQLWNSYVSARKQPESTFTPIDVAVMMALLKIVRTAQGNAAEVDHWIDAAGYIALAGEIATRQAERGDDSRNVADQAQALYSDFLAKASAPPTPINDSCEHCGARF